ncbi:MAG: hypothetical protein HRT89_00345, partial [Lentisphaeria bacterium]|nr:hypothetical protein [Lentisphaeria bacterium]NQZ66492.1 hypothetical protein [Lentisphaeria bacterium]
MSETIEDSNAGKILKIKIVILIVSLLMVFFLRAHGFTEWYGKYTEPLEGDECTYMLMAKIWNDGGIPYVDMWDNKPIGTFILYRIGIVIWGYTE